MVAPVPRLANHRPPKPAPCSDDATLRECGFAIVSRPKSGPDLWSRRGHEPIPAAQAHAVIAGEAAQAAEQASAAERS